MIDKRDPPAVDDDESDRPIAYEDDRLLDEPEVKEITKLSQTTRWRKRKKGEFPPLILGRFHTMGQIREWKARERKKAEARAEAALTKSEMPPSRGRPPRTVEQVE
ncbi:helix-turn-helix transcriptional regulator [Ensifer sp. 22460]|uniref:helix-turn-helix transcriptional regulator n=1 Tax=Ensifer sp. 22460 TaxID=3453922 RepID=UPI003F87601A